MLSDLVRRLARGTNLATVVTLMPDGRPQAQFTWIDTDGETLLVNTRPTTQRYKNLRRDPRVTVLIPSEHPWVFAEIRGHLIDTIAGQPARDQIDALARRYLGTDSYPNPVGPEGRVILRIAADKVNERATEDQRSAGRIA